MKTSAAGVAEIAGHEGIVPYPYLDSVGVWTFGIGHTASAGSPNPADLPRGEEQPLSAVLSVFRADLAKFEKRVSDAVKVSLAQHEFDALVSFDFNTSGIFKANLTKLLNKGDRAGAAEGFNGWHKPREIIPRRNAEKRLFESGIYSGDGKANVYPANANGKVLWSKARKVDVLQLMADDAPAPRPQPDEPPPEKPAEPPRSGLIGLLIRIFNAIFGGK